MTKPFHKDEPVARAHAILRRSKGHADSSASPPTCPTPSETLIYAVYVLGDLIAFLVFGRLSDQIGRACP